MQNASSKTIQLDDHKGPRIKHGLRSKFIHSRNKKIFGNLFKTFKEVMVIVIIILVVFSSLWFYTDNWPPLAIVESKSMMHGADSAIGTMDTGDIVLIKSVSNRHDIKTYIEGQKSNYMTYDSYGDVIAFNKNGDSSTALIHRAVVWIEYNASGHNNDSALYGFGSFDIPSMGLYDVTQVKLKDYDPGHITLYLDLKTILYNFKNYNRKPHGGFLTKGDNNLEIDQFSLFTDSSGRPLEPIVNDWIIGKAEGEVPWFGLISLYASGKTSNPQSTPPDTSIVMLIVSIIIIIILILITPQIKFLNLRRIRQKRRRREEVTLDLDMDINKEKDWKVFLREKELKVIEKNILLKEKNLESKLDEIVLETKKVDEKIKDNIKFEKSLNQKKEELEIELERSSAQNAALLDSSQGQYQRPKPLGEPLQIELDSELNDIGLYVQHSKQLGSTIASEFGTTSVQPDVVSIQVHYDLQLPVEQQAPSELQSFPCRSCKEQFMAIPGLETQIVACQKCGSPNIVLSVEKPPLPAPTPVPITPLAPTTPAPAPVTPPAPTTPAPAPITPPAPTTPARAPMAMPVITHTPTPTPMPAPTPITPAFAPSPLPAKATTAYSAPRADYFSRKARVTENKPETPILKPEFQQSYSELSTCIEQVVKINMQKLADLLGDPNNPIKFYESGKLIYPKVTMVQKSVYKYFETREMDILLIQRDVKDYMLIANESQDSADDTLLPIQDELFAINTLGYATFHALEDWAKLDHMQKFAISKCIFDFTDI